MIRKKGAVVRSWAKEQLFHEGDAFFDELKSGINRAQSSVTLETYIFRCDVLGKSIIETLNGAARRGVEIRVLVDGVGTSFFDIRYLFANLHHKIRARVYHPLPWFLFFWPSHWPNCWVDAFSGLFRFFSKINRRNHRKTCVIDNYTAWVSSMNICGSHLAWRDTGVEVEGNDVSRLTVAFDRAWETAEFSAPARRRSKTSHLVRLNDTWRARRRSYESLLRRINSARRRIWITNAYFVPHWRLLRALGRAARRGIDVKVLVPRNCDIPFIPLVRAALYGGLIDSGVKIFEYMPSMLHAKSLLVDDWAILGSSNLNHRSLIHDLEADIVLTKNDNKLDLEDHFRRDLIRSTQVDRADLENRSWFKNRSGRALLLLKNWM